MNSETAGLLYLNQSVDPTMKITYKLTNSGISLSLGDETDEAKLKPSKDADQKQPKKFYVYAHNDSEGKTFYIGKGKGRRAWSKDRHSLWDLYVDKYLCNKYQVLILKDNLSEAEAEELESEWIAYYGTQLVNWENMARDIDFEKLNVFQKLRNKNKALIQDARRLEKENIDQAIEMYITAIESIDEYQSIEYEGGLVGQLLKEESEIIGQFGEVEALDRLSMCLIKVKQIEEASNRAKGYFERYRGDLQLSAAERIKKRIDKELVKLSTLKGVV